MPESSNTSTSMSPADEQIQEASKADSRKNSMEVTDIKENGIKTSKEVSVEDSLNGNRRKSTKSDKASRSDNNDVNPDGDKTTKRIKNQTKISSPDATQISECGKEARIASNVGADDQDSKPYSKANDVTNGRTNKILHHLSSELVHFCLNIDIRSVKSMSLKRSPTVLLQYSYPFVGADKQIRTSLITLDTRATIIPDGQHSFCFVTTYDRLQEAFQRLPLTIELITNESILGLAHVTLEPLLKQPTTFVSFSDNVRGHRSTFSCDVPVMNRESPSIAEISLFLSLDRLEGKASAKCVTELHSRNLGTSEPEPPSANILEHSRKHLRQPLETEVRTIMELEVWREHQEQLFRVMLKKKEEAHLSALAQEWKERDAERELLLQTRINECTRLEDKLRRALCDIDNRETKVRRKEESLLKREAELKRKTEELEKQIKSQQRLKKSPADSSASGAVCSLQSKVSTLEQALKESTEEKIKAVDSKERYKTLWARTLQELVSVRNNVASPAPLPQIRFPSFGSASEPKVAILQHQQQLQKEKADLKQIQEEVRRLKMSTQANIDNSYTAENDQGLQQNTDYLKQLIDERSMLLSTGSYSPDNKVIQQLDRHIRLARNV